MSMGKKRLEKVMSNSLKIETNGSSGKSNSVSVGVSGVLVILMESFVSALLMVRVDVWKVLGWMVVI